VVEHGAAERIEPALETVELRDRARDRVGGYSHGMRQRLGIAAALLRAPRLLLLDEPATGLDPAGMRDMRLLVRRLADSGMTVLLSSHLLAEVEELCNRVGIVDHGTMAYEGTLDDLRRAADGVGDAYVRAVVVTDGPVPGVAEQVREFLPGALAVELEYPRRDDGPSPAAVRTLRPRDQFAAYHRHAHGADPDPALLGAFDRVYADVAEGR
jgi:ABC-type multidrug transport system ATPase subunit